MDREDFTLETIYRDALEEIRLRRDSGLLSSKDFHVITSTHDVLKLYTLLMTADSCKNGTRSPAAKTKTRDAVEPILLRFERFGTAIDMLAQSSPQVMGISAVGLLWGSLKFVLTITHDIYATFDAVFDMLEQVAMRLPVLETYIGLFGSSENQLLKAPLIDIYTTLILFGIQALKLFDRSNIHTLGRSTWNSLLEDFKPLIMKIERLGQDIERKAEAEHMHQSDKAIKIQALENQRAEEFREEVRRLFAQQPLNGSLEQLPLQLSIQDAPSELLSAHFTGRLDELSRLREIFDSIDGSTPRRCAVYGMPGVGKTQLALRYAISGYERQRYQHVFWISARTNERMHQGLANLLNLVSHVDRIHPEDSARMIAARRWLEECRTLGRERWLLVIDNVERLTVEMLRTHLPRKNHTRHILFTTRTEGTAKALTDSPGDQHGIIHLQPLGPDDAVHLLLNGAGLHHGTLHTAAIKAKAEVLVETVGCLPLAVDHAASFLAQTHKTLDDLSGMYSQEQRSQLLSWNNDFSKHEQKSVAATFTWQLDELSRRFPDASKIMKIMSFLDPESFGVDVFTPKEARSSIQTKGEDAKSGNKISTIWLQSKRRWQDRVNRDESERNPTQTTNAAHKELETLLPILRSPTKALAAMPQLGSLSLIEERTDIPNAYLHMHELIQVIVQDKTKAEDTQEFWFECAEMLVCSAFSEIPDLSSHTSWNSCEKFIPHIQALTRWSEAHQGPSNRLCQANVGVAAYYRARGRYGDAEAIYVSTMDHVMSELGPKHLKTLQAMQDLASVHELQGRYFQAETLYRSALTETQDLLGPSSLRALQISQNLAIVYMHLGRYDEAEHILRKTLRGRTKRLGADHKHSLRTAHHLGGVLKRQNKLSEAEELYRTTLGKRERGLGFDHQDTLATVQDFASLCMAQGRLGEAEALYDRVLQGRETQFGPEHPQTFRTLQNVAVLYAEQGHDDKAEELYKKALNGWTRSLGSEHPETLLVMQNLATLYERQGQLGKAEDLLQKASTGFQKQLGEEHPSALKTMHGLGVVYERLGRREEAELFYKRALAGRGTVLGTEHVDTVRTKLRYAAFLDDIGRGEEAARLRV